MKRGKLLVISGPSGCGKSTVIGKMMAGRENVEFSVSATTRRPRPGEREGVDYFFVSRERFEEMLRNDELLEHAEFVGNCYGTPKSQVCARLESGVSVILDIEVQGAAQVKRKLPEAVTVFLAPPGLEALERLSPRPPGRNRKRRSVRGSTQHGARWRWLQPMIIL